MTHGIYMPEHAAMLVDQSGQKWRPSNGTEGEIFMGSWCDKCMRGANCRIQQLTMIYDEDDAEYPHEWQYGDDGQPKCTAFEPANG